MKDKLGFFTKEEMGVSITNCVSCKLYKGCNSPKMKVSGKGESKILIIGEAPGKTEDEQGHQFIGSAGDVLMDGLEANGLYRSDCWFINAVNCRPPENRTPTKREIKLCSPRVEEVIRKKKPHIIILLGNIALQSFMLERFKKQLGGINKWRGFAIPEHSVNAWVMPMFHPSYVMRSEGIPAIRKVFTQDLKNVRKYINKPLPKKENYAIKIENDPSEVIRMLDYIIQYKPLLAFDYETTGIKPHAKGHKIFCCGICYFNKNVGTVFELKNEDVIQYWQLILTDKDIKKTAHNIKFEEAWSKEILKTKVRGWKWDSMIAAHIIDNRPKITSLEFQAYVNFGQQDYSSHIDKYLKSDGGGNNFNTIHDADPMEIMEYCGMDALLQYKLAKKQMEEMK